MTAEDSARRRHIGIVAANSGANVAVASEQTVGGIESHPSQGRQQCFHPGMSCVNYRAVVILRAAIEISADVAARNSQAAHQRDHDVGKILAHALRFWMASSIGESTFVLLGTYSKYS